jgi:hypothetical protein
MGVPCSICKHARRAEIDSAILTDGASEKIAKAFGVSKFALKRHRVHQAELLAATPTKRLMAATDVDTIIGKIDRLEKRAERLLDKAEVKEDYRTALSAITTLKNLLEFLANITGAMQKAQTTQNTMNVFVTEEKLDELIARRAQLFPSERRRQAPALPETARG